MDFILDAFLAGLASIGFGMVFNVPKRELFFCALGGAITLSSRNLFLHFGVQIEFAVFFASTIIGIISLIWSLKYNVPRLVYTVASIIPIIPGIYAIRAMVGLLNMNTYGVSTELINTFIENFLKAGSILAALSFGIAIPSIYFIRLNKPDV